MKEEGTKPRKNGAKPVLKTALKWGAAGFIVGIIMPFVMGGMDIPFGIFPSLFVLGLLDTHGYKGIFHYIIYNSSYLLLVNGLIIGVLFYLISLLKQLYLTSYKDEKK